MHVQESGRPSCQRKTPFFIPALIPPNSKAMQCRHPEFDPGIHTAAVQEAVKMACSSTSPAPSPKSKQSSGLGIPAAMPVDGVETQVDIDIDYADSAVSDSNAVRSVTIRVLVDLTVPEIPRSAVRGSGDTGGLLTGWD